MRLIINLINGYTAVNHGGLTAESDRGGLIAESERDGLTAARAFSLSLFLVCILIFCLLTFNSTVYAQEEEEMETSTEEIITDQEERAPDLEYEGDISDLEDTGTLRAATEADSTWRKWMEIDEDGIRSYWIRRSFLIEDRPTGGRIWITADDDYNLYVNGSYIAADDAEEVDWMTIDDHDIMEFLVEGKNTIAIQVDDVDDSRHGLLVGMSYETIPDIKTKLDRMVQKELESQEVRKTARIQRQQAEQQLRVNIRKLVSEEELRDMRAIEKNKLD
ncbi:MAG: hypothetical protein P9X24_14655 [Candidatus Hatepunaea meridiana]|nr:hypothetical protein [Candidatus Hatepunaea meridiana]